MDWKAAFADTQAGWLYAGEDFVPTYLLQYYYFTCILLERDLLVLYWITDRMEDNVG